MTLVVNVKSLTEMICFFFFTFKELSSSEYSYALPNEVRPITYSKRSVSV